MKQLYKTTFKSIILAAVSFIAVPAQAQLGDVGEILRAGVTDANILAQEYLRPFGEGFGAGLNSGWVMGAHTHKFLGFDVAIRVGLAQVPTARQTFSALPSDLNLTRLQLKSGSPTTTPTLVGDEDAPTASYEIIENGFKLADLDLPGALPSLPVVGAGVPVPMVQAGIGLFFNTDVTIRYLPEQEIKDFGSISLTGASVKHGLNQWIPVPLPIDVAVQAGFTSLNVTSPLDVQPESGSDVKNTYPASTWAGQSIDFKSSGYTINALVGKDIDLLIIGITVYGGIGIESAKTTVKTPGMYPITSVNDNQTEYLQGTTKKIEAIDSPLNLEYDSANSTRFTVGAKVRLFLINVIAEYTVAEYPMLSAGVAISIR